VLGCQLTTDLSELTTSHQSEPQEQGYQLPEWSRLRLSSLPEATKHSGAVLTAIENPSSPGQLISVGADGSIIGWDLKSYSGHFITSLSNSISIAALGEKRPLLASYNADGISIVCITNCQRSWKLNRLKIRPTALAFQGADSALLIAGADGRVYRWRFMDEGLAKTVQEQEKILERYAAHQNIVSAVASHPFGRAFFTGDWNGTMFGWLPYTADAHGGAYDRNLFGARFYSDKGTFVQALRKPDRGISAMSVSSSGEQLGLGSEEGYVEVWEVKGFVQSAREALHSGRVLSVSFDTKGERIASVGRDMMVSVAVLERDPSFGTALQTTPWKLVRATHQRIENAKDVVFLKSGNLIVTTSDGTVAEMSDLKQPVAPPAPTAHAANQVQDTDY
jgi:WD40 repeat protein